MNKVKKGDTYFLGAMVAVLCVHLVFSFLPHFLPDESFYATIPYRLVNGDSLFQDEWHLSQISSFFSYLPVKFWVKVNGSADGLFLFLRLTYLTMHTVAALVIYRLFRTYKFWAAASALIYYLQTPYKLYAISYNSMFAFFLLLFSVCLYLNHRNNTNKLTFWTGVFYAACCVANPAFVITLCLIPIWYVQNQIKKTAQEKLQISEAEQPRLSANSCSTDFGFLFGRQNILYFLLGILSVAIMGFLFFFGTKGTISSAFHNLPAMLDSSEYSSTSGGIFYKMGRIAAAINNLTLNRPYWILLLFLTILFDRKRKKNTHRLFYLLSVIPLSVLCILGMRFSPKIDHSLLQSFPVALLTVVCYTLTEKKNRPLFLYMWCPCVVAALINLYISNTVLSAAGFVLAVGNVPGTILIRDLFHEMRADNKTTEHTRTEGLVQRLSHIAICTTLVLQILFYLYIVQFGQPVPDTVVNISDGPYAGMIMDSEDSEYYRASLKDLDIIRERSSEEDPVLVVSYQSWMYLYIQRPIATYTTWYDAYLDTQALRSYYKRNPDKVPKYIYVVFSDNIEPLGMHIDNVRFTEDEINSLFSYTAEELTNGMLLTITAYHGND